MDAEILFSTKKKKGPAYGNVYIHRKDKSPIIINGGTYRTTNREEITDLLHSDLMRRGLLNMVTPSEIVDKWLLGEIPDSLTEEILSKVDEDGLRELAVIYKLNKRKHGGHGSIIKSMLRGKSINNGALLILEKHASEEGVEDFLKLTMEEGLVYRNAPWYKYRVGDEQDISKDISIGRSEDVAQQWVIDRREEIEARFGT